MDRKQRKGLMIAGGVLVILVVVLAVLYNVLWKPQGTVGKKTITIEIVTEEETIPIEDIRTNAEFLREVLETEKIVEGTESEYGLFIESVHGVVADSSKEEWWCVTKNGGETVETGVDTTPIEDGDTFELTLTTGW